MLQREIMDAIEEEVRRADEKHGPGLDRAMLPDVTLRHGWTWHGELGIHGETIARSRLCYNTLTGRDHAWIELIICELSEVVTAAGEYRERPTADAKKHLIAELTQVACLCVKAIRSLIFQ